MQKPYYDIFFLSGECCGDSCKAKYLDISFDGKSLELKLEKEKVIIPKESSKKFFSKLYKVATQERIDEIANSIENKEAQKIFKEGLEKYS